MYVFKRYTAVNGYKCKSNSYSHFKQNHHLLASIQCGKIFNVFKTHGVRDSLEYLNLLWEGIQPIIFGIGDIDRPEYDVLEIF